MNERKVQKFEECYEKYKDLVFRYLVKVSGYEEKRAAELFQEVWMEFWTEFRFSEDEGPVLETLLELCDKRIRKEYKM